LAEKAFELGEGLELWRFNVDEVLEQDVNARTMTKEKFDRMTQTIKKDRRLEQLPFMATTDRGLEVVGGHHRIRSMRAAGVTDGWALVDVTGLPRDNIKAKQLAHNAINGFDDPQLLEQIFASIGDVDARLETSLDPRTLSVNIPRIKVDDVDLGLRFETVIIMFIPFEKDYVKEALRAVETELAGTNSHEAWLADLDYWEGFRKIGRQLTREYDIHTMSTVLWKMAELAQKQMGTPPPDDQEAVSIRDLAGAFYIPADAAAVIRQALDRMLEAGEVTERAPWRAFEMWAADYLAGPSYTDGHAAADSNLAAMERGD
jgi:hypothetical protein